MRDNIDIIGYIMCLCLALAITFTIGFYHGTLNEQDKWEQWCLENDYAYYDNKSGELILRDSDWWTNWFNKFVKPDVPANPTDLPAELDIEEPTI